MDKCDQKNMTVTISKDELATLPIAGYNGTIRLIDSEDDARQAVEILSSESLIGFDTETKPSFRKGQSNTVALLQLSTHTECFLFRLNHIGLPDCVKQLLESDKVIKVGLSIHDDFHNLKKLSDLEPNGFIDLQNYVKQYNIADNSLARIYGILFGKRISKGQRLTNWEASDLTASQQQYASLDALACIQIYDFLSKGNFKPEQSPYYREIIIPEPSKKTEDSSPAEPADKRTDDQDTFNSNTRKSNTEKSNTEKPNTEKPNTKNTRQIKPTPKKKRRKKTEIDPQNATEQ